jgi:hypothetical protein
MKKKRPWYLVLGLAIGLIVGAFLTPEWYSSRTAKYVYGCGAVGLLLGLVADVLASRLHFHTD